MSIRPDRPTRQSIARAFVCAGRGIAEFVREGRNSKVQLGAGGAAVVLGVVLRLSTTEWAVLTLMIAAVLSAEAMNTAVERTVDLVSPDFHPLAGRAKDLAAGAVLILSLAAMVVGAFLFLPKLWLLIHSST